MPDAKLDLDALVAIDVHTHAEASAHEPRDPVTACSSTSHGEVLRRTPPQPTTPRSRTTTASARWPRSSSPSTPRPGWATARSPTRRSPRSPPNTDVLIPFATIDPHKGKMGVREARRLIEDYGVRGFKFHPTTQGFYPNDRTSTRCTR